MEKNKNTSFFSVVFFLSVICFVVIQIFISKYHLKLKSNTEIGKEILRKNTQSFLDEEISKKSNVETNNESNSNNNDEINEEDSDYSEINNSYKNSNNVKEINTEKPITNVRWQIKIPKINLIANIQEGTDKETLNKYVGHFEETQKEEGNIGLAGHNRGYEVNYFARLRELQKGDKIIYQYNNYKRTYEVIRILIIKDTNWEVLENTEENILTLITCVENEPEYRRCVQAEELIEK